MAAAAVSTPANIDLRHRGSKRGDRSLERATPHNPTIDERSNGLLARAIYSFPADLRIRIFFRLFWGETQQDLL